MTLDINKVLTLDDLLSGSLVFHGEERKWLRGALEEAIAEAVKKSRKHGKNSNVVLRFNFMPQKGTNQMNWSAELTESIPKPPPQDMTGFTDNMGRLVMTDPDQPPIPGLMPSNAVDFKAKGANDDSGSN